MFNFLSDLIPPCTAILSSLGFIKTQQASIERLQSYGIFFGEIMILPSCVMISMQIKVFPAAATHFNPNFVGKKICCECETFFLLWSKSFNCILVCLSLPEGLAWHGCFSAFLCPHLPLFKSSSPGGRREGSLQWCRYISRLQTHNFPEQNPWYACADVIMQIVNS